MLNFLSRLINICIRGGQRISFMGLREFQDDMNKTKWQVSPLGRSLARIYSTLGRKRLLQFYMLKTVHVTKVSNENRENPTFAKISRTFSLIFEIFFLAIFEQFSRKFSTPFSRNISRKRGQYFRENRSTSKSVNLVISTINKLG